MKFASLVPSENGTAGEEIAGNQVNVSARQINLANAWGADDWEKSNSPMECSSITDAGFNGGGLRVFSWLRKYLEYVRSFYPKENLLKTRGWRGVLKFAFLESSMAGFGGEYRHTHLGEWDF